MACAQLPGRGDIVHSIIYNGYIENFNGKLRMHFLSGGILDTLLEANALIERWSRGNNTIKYR